MTDNPADSLFINGSFSPAHTGGVFPSFNPFDQSCVGHFALASAEDIDRAVEAARHTWQSKAWQSSGVAQRAGWLRQLADGLKGSMPELVKLEIADAGSIQSKAREDVFLAMSWCHQYADWLENSTQEARLDLGPVPPGQMNLLRREPTGVVGAIVPWNFPLKMAINKIAPALATGNTIVLKPSEETPASAMALAKIIAQTDLPPGAVNILTGTGATAGAALAAHPGISHLSFTGSTEVGRQVMMAAARNLVGVTLECGGKSANLVLPDAPLAMAVEGSVYAIFYHAGQCCEAGSRLFVPSDRASEFIERFISHARALRMGNPADRRTQAGPLISQVQMDKVLGMLERAGEDGAHFLLGGRRGSTPGLEKGWFVEPTVVAEASAHSEIARQEVFGPVVTVFTYRDEDEMVAMANDSDYGLAAGIWTADTQNGVEIARRLQAGTVWINDYHQMHVRAPFGGYRQSGIGREFGEAGALALSELKHIHVSTTENADRDRRWKHYLPQA